MAWAGAIFCTGWILRCISSYHTSNPNLYIAQTVLVLAGPPIYSAAEYNVLGRLMRYLPMHAPLHPGRVVVIFVYAGIAVESLTSAGASLYATASVDDASKFKLGGTLISISLVLQAVIEVVFISLVAVIHRRCVRHRMLTPNVRKLCIMLYGTSAFVLIRCIFRAIESFALHSTDDCSANSLCRFVSQNEWYLYAFEAAPMVIYTYWINVIHPGRLLPSSPNRYLDTDGATERMGPGWVDTRSRWETFVDPLDVGGVIRGRPAHEEFWLKSDVWPVAEGGSFARGTATNVKRR
ncbi:RTA1 domain-containing protein [Oscillospiraceae bacterium SCCA1]|nr:RTA1 domain-containing protein [Oscillospiraceae bacterium SCCA1]